VFFVKIYNKMMELGDLLLVIFWKLLSEGCLLSKREAIPLRKTLAPVFSCRKLPGWNPIFFILLPFQGLLTAQAMVEVLDHCFFSP